MTTTDPFASFNISRECISCDACGLSNPPLQCERCKTTYYCSVACRRDHAHTCRDIETVRSGIAGIEESNLAPSSPGAIGSSCAICLEDPTVEQRIVLPACRHEFCRSCLSDWHQYQLTNGGSGGSGGTCPCCRTKISRLTMEKFLIDRAMLLCARAKKQDRRLKIKTCQQAQEELSKVLDGNIQTESATLQAIFARVEILLTLGESKEAITALGYIIEIDKIGFKVKQRMKQFLDRMKEAMDVGNDGEIEGILRIIDIIGGEEDENLKTAIMDEEGRVNVQLKFAEALQQLKNWEGAKRTYKKVLDLGLLPLDPLFVFIIMPIYLWTITTLLTPYDTIVQYASKKLSIGLFVVGIFYNIVESIRRLLRKKDNKYLPTVTQLSSCRNIFYRFYYEFSENKYCPTITQQCSCWSELCRCYYELGDYDRSIIAGLRALKLNRHYAGAHKYVALAHSAKGNLKEAERTMNRAVLYETPWDEDNRQTQKQLFRFIQIVTKSC